MDLFKSLTKLMKRFFPEKEGQEGSSKSGSSKKRKLIENAIAIIIFGIILLIAASSLFSGKGQDKEGDSTNGTQEVAAASRTSEIQAEGTDEKEMETILSQIEGAGKVTVMITYSSGKEVVPAYDSKSTENSTDEKDSGGGTRSIQQSDQENSVVFQDEQGGTKKPVLLKEKMPEVKGVVVVADGGGNPQVCEKLTKAVQVLVDVPIHRIQVFARKSP